VDACVGIRSVGGLEDGEFSRRGEVDRGFVYRGYPQRQVEG
jgi:hypothetical protein